MEVYAEIENETTDEKQNEAQMDKMWSNSEQAYRVKEWSQEETAQPFRIHLTPIVGKFDLFVSNTPSNLDIDADIFYYDWCDCNNSTA